MTPLLAAGIGLVVAVVVIRVAIAQHVEAVDRRRPRSPSGVVVGAEGFTLEREGAPAVLLLHGAGDTPQTLRGLAEHLHTRGFAVRAPLLPGHGRTVRDFRTVSADAWQTAALAAYDEMAAHHPWNGIAGLSLGGALAVLTAAVRPEAAAIVLLAPYLDLPRGLRVAAALSWAIGLVSPYFASGDDHSVRDPAAAARGLAYGVFTIPAARALRAVADGARAALPRVRVPTLIVQSQRDNRVAPAVATTALARLGARDKQLEWVSDGGHVITVDYGKEQVFALTSAWLESHGAGALLRS